MEREYRAVISAIEIALTILMLLISVALVVVVSMQESAQQGAGALYGGTSDLLGKIRPRARNRSSSAIPVSAAWRWS